MQELGSVEGYRRIVDRQDDIFTYSSAGLLPRSPKTRVFRALAVT